MGGLPEKRQDPWGLFPGKDRTRPHRSVQEWSLLSAACQGWRWSPRGSGHTEVLRRACLGFPSKPLSLGLSTCPQAAGAEQFSPYRNLPPIWVGPGVWDPLSPAPHSTLWPGILAGIEIPRPSLLAPTMDSPSSPDLPKAHPFCLPAGLGEASGLGASRVSFRRPDGVTSLW